MAKFVWAARDMLQPVNDDGEEIDEEIYVENQLKKTGLYDDFKRTFKKSEVFLFANSCYNPESKTIDQRFMKTAAQLQAYIYEHGNPKQCNGKFLNGAAFASYMREFFQTITGEDDFALSPFNNKLKSSVTMMQMEKLGEYIKCWKEEDFHINYMALVAKHEASLRKIIKAFKSEKGDNKNNVDRLKCLIAGYFGFVVCEKNEMYTNLMMEHNITRLNEKIIENHVHDGTYRSVNIRNQFEIDMEEILHSLIRKEREGHIVFKQSVFDRYKRIMTRVKFSYHYMENVESAYHAARQEWATTCMSQWIWAYIHYHNISSTYQEMLLDVFKRSIDTLIKSREKHKIANISGASGGYVSSALAIAAVCTLFFPPVALGLGIASGGVGVVSGVTTMASKAAEKKGIEKVQLDIGDIFLMTEIYTEMWMFSYTTLEEATDVHMKISDPLKSSNINAMYMDFKKYIKRSQPLKESIVKGNGGSQGGVVDKGKFITGGLQGAAKGMDIVDDIIPFARVSAKGVKVVPFIGLAFSLVGNVFDSINIHKERKNTNEDAKNLQEQLSLMEKMKEENASIPVEELAECLKRWISRIDINNFAKFVEKRKHVCVKPFNIVCE